MRYLREGGERAPDIVSLEHPPTPLSFDYKELAEQVKRLQGEREGDGEHPRYVRPMFIPSGPILLTPEGKVDYWMWTERIKAKRQAFLDGTGGNPLEQWAREVLIARNHLSYLWKGYFPTENR